MRRESSSVGRVAFAVVLALGLRSTLATAAVPERLKWVRGTIAAVTSSSVTTEFRQKTLPIAIDEATEVMLVTHDGITRPPKALSATAYLKVGDAIEVHYRDGRSGGTARYIWVGIPLDPNAISRRPGTSAAGSIAAVRPGNRLLSPRMTLTSGKDSRSFSVASGAQVMDARGAVASAKTRLPPAADALGLNDRAVVLYREGRSTLTAHLIRMLPR